MSYVRPLYPLHLLFDHDVFRSLPDRNEAPGHLLWDPLHWESFLDRVADAFELPALTDPKERWAGGTLVWYVAADHRFKVGIDIANEPHAVFVTPRSYERRQGAILRPYKVARFASRGFNRLIRACPEVQFSRRLPDGSFGPITRYSAHNALWAKGVLAR